jgi:hypothetical protein
MIAGQEELIPEEEAALLGIAWWRLRELAAEGELRMILAEVPGGRRLMYFPGEVLALKGRLRGGVEEVEEWTDVIGG